MCIRDSSHVSSTNSEQTIVTLNRSTQTANSYIFHIKAESNNQTHLASINATLTPSNAVSINQYGELKTGGDLATYDITASATQILVKATPINSVTKFEILRFSV